MLYCAIAFGLIFASIWLDIYLGYTLTVVVGIFYFYCVKHGISFKQVNGFIVDGAKKGFIVAQILLLIAVNTALWMACGCIASLIQYGTSLIIPQLFLAACFLLCAGFSYLLGSSFATCATIGVVVYIVGNAGGANPAMVAGAVISGAYVGDRASPVSSSLALLSVITEYDHNKTMSLLGKTSIIPVALTSVMFTLLSLFNPIDRSALTQLSGMGQVFKIGIIPLVPAIVLLTICAMKFKMKMCIIISIAISVAVAIFYQGVTPWQIAAYAWSGFSLPQDNPLYHIIKGGGILPMLKSLYIIMVSCSLAVIVEKSGVLGKDMEAYLLKPASRTLLYFRNCAMALLSAGVGCNQTMSIVMTSRLMKAPYDSMGFPLEEQVRDLSFTGVLLSAIPPWSMAVVVPLSSLQYEGLGYMPFMFFTFIAPICNLIYCIYYDKKQSVDN